MQDFEFGPTERWLAAGMKRYMRCDIAAGVWTVHLYERGIVVGYGTGASMAEACAASLNNIMARMGALG